MKLEQRVSELERHVSALKSLVAAHEAVIRALITTHPRYDDFQLVAASVISVQMAQGSRWATNQDLIHSRAEALRSTPPLKPGEIQQWIEAMLKTYQQSDGAKE